MRPLEVLGEFADALTWQAVPTAAQNQARLALRDTIGTIIGGASTCAGRIAAQATENASTPVVDAFVTGVHASALDFDDGHYRGGAIHPGSVVVSALLVAARDSDATIEELLTAQVVGYEIGLRAAHLLWPRHPLDDYHCTGTSGALGAAAAVAKLRDADADVVARAIAVAWAHAPMSTFQLPMVKESIGWSAATGLFAADLAAAGFMATPHPVTSAMDATFAPTPFHRDGAMDDEFVATLGTVFEAANTYFKPYASCRYTHTAIRSLIDVMAENDLAAADIDHVDVRTPRPAMNLTERRPVTLEHAQYSFPFVLAAAMHTGRAGATEICDSALTDDALLASAARVQVRHDPELDAHYPAHYGTRIDVRATDGRTFERVRLLAPGDPHDPMSDHELAAKFVRLAAPMYGEATVARAAALVDAGADRTPASTLMPR